MKGILFKPWKIKAIADSPLDRLWQTRRVVKIDHLGWLKCGEARYCFVHKESGEHHVFKPRYQVGEVVYLRETLFRHPYLNEAGYVLDNSPVFINQTIGDMLKWRWQKDILSAMFMPQEAARYFIQITDVRAERLQEITDMDCEKEGLDNPCGYYCDEAVGHVDHQGTINNFSKLWESINGKGSWDKNDWVWVYSFKRMED